ncbi:MAG: DUF1499 domain-containing protein [Nitrospirae bacterium]|nr:DUF1499 domain-containing protein [Nitrospirota bacterium]
MEGQQNRGQPLVIALLPEVGFSLAVLAGLAAALAGFGHRWGWWHYRTGFMVLKGAAYVGIAAAAVSVAGLIMTRPLLLRQGAVLSLAGILVGLLTAGIPWSWQRTIKKVPRIHDITTDTENPPTFVAILPLRKNAMNPAEYGGPDIAAQQRKGYPDIVPLHLAVQPARAFEQAVQAARDMGWEIVDASSDRLHIEATDTTFWFGFKDDVVVRVMPDPQGSRIDVRSLSRVGKSDVGTNAKRIRAFLRKLDQMK